MARGRPTKKQQSERRWTQVAAEILRHTSALVLLLRDPARVSLEQARERLQEFQDRWLKTGEGDILPNSGENADVEGALSDVDVTQFIISAIDMRLDE